VTGIVAADANNGIGVEGVAPQTTVLVVKVLDDTGAGSIEQVAAGIDYARTHGADVINLSLGPNAPVDDNDPTLDGAIQRAVDAGIVVVAAAGNFGKMADGTPVVGGIISPGNAPAALTVGALNTFGTAQRSDDRMATYSSRGPTLIDGVLKPELVAPGNRIVATAAAGSYLAETYPDRVVAGHGSNPYMEMSGTSMSSAVVAGAVALLLEANPRLTPADVKLVLQLTSSRVPGAGLIETGAGSLNIASAVTFGAGGALADVVLAGEAVAPTGIAFGPFSLTALARVTGLRVPVTLAPINLATTIVWGETIVWAETIVWGETIVWADTIVWSDTIVWGETIVWSEKSARADTIVWSDTIVWGETIVWAD
jgi:serine protease AprX